MFKYILNDNFVCRNPSEQERLFVENGGKKMLKEPFKENRGYCFKVAGIYNLDSLDHKIDKAFIKDLIIL